MIEIVAFLALLAYCALPPLFTPWRTDDPDLWYRGSKLIFAHVPGLTNHGPIAVPAYAYRALDAFLSALGVSARREVFAIYVMNHALIFAAGILFYSTGKSLGYRRSSLVAALGLVAYAVSTRIAMMRMSEPFSLFLMAAVLRMGVALIRRFQSHPSGRPWGLLTAFSLTLGMFVVTRAVPIVILPLLLLVSREWRHTPLYRAVAYVGATAVVGLILLHMVGNYFRFDRFEWSDSGWKHLFDTLSPHAELMLADDPYFQRLMKDTPTMRSVADRFHYEFNWRPLAAEIHKTEGEICKAMFLHGARRHPWLYFRSGLRRLGLGLVHFRRARDWFADPGVLAPEPERLLPVSPRVVSFFETVEDLASALLRTVACTGAYLFAILLGWRIVTRVLPDAAPSVAPWLLAAGWFGCLFLAKATGSRHYVLGPTVVWLVATVSMLNAGPSWHTLFRNPTATRHALFFSGSVYYASFYLTVGLLENGVGITSRYGIPLLPALGLFAVTATRELSLLVRAALARRAAPRPGGASLELTAS